MSTTGNTTSTNDNQRREAVEHVRQLKRFYRDLMSYIIINIVLVVINLVTSPHHLWFYWVTIFWGLGVFYHAINVFGPGRKFNKEWEDRKIQEYLNKRK
jgi:hypothetical protein